MNFKGMIENFKNDHNLAIIWKDQEIEYDELYRRVINLSNWLQQEKIKCNDVVAVVIQDSPMLLYLFLAISSIGAKFMGLNTKFTNSEIEQHLINSKAKLIIADDCISDKLFIQRSKYRLLLVGQIPIQAKQLNIDIEIDTDGGDAILFTSGSVGISKGVLHSQNDFMITAQNCSNAWGITHVDRIISGIPLLSAASLGCAVIVAFFKKATIVISEKRNALHLLNTIAKTKATFLLGTPTTYCQLMVEIRNNNFDITSMNKGSVAGAIPPTNLVDEFHALTKVKLFPHYGMTELLAITSVTKDSSFQTVGIPFSNIKLRILDTNNRQVNCEEIGEVVVKSPAMGSQYLDGKPLGDSDGWFKTGDLGYQNSGGELTIVGRKQESINRGGNNIYPEEIERIIQQAPHIKDASVIGVPDNIYGQKVVAYITTKNSANIDTDTLLSWLKDNVPIYRIPQEIIFLEEMPLTANGKIAKNVLKERWAANNVQ